MKYTVPISRRHYKRPCLIFSYLSRNMMEDFEKLVDLKETSKSSYIRVLLKEAIMRELNNGKR